MPTFAKEVRGIALGIALIGNSEIWVAVDNLYPPLNPNSARNRDHGRLQTDCGHSEFWDAEKNMPSATHQTVLGECRLTEIQRPLKLR
jgi:hypothetical protein